MWRRNSSNGRAVRTLSCVFTFSLMASGAGSAFAETMNNALAKAYLSNPNINQQRAGVRATDEGVPKAVSGYFPTVNGEADIGVAALRSNLNPFNSNTVPHGVGLTVQQTLWNGNRTENGVKQAESTVLESREQLRSTEESVLLNAATAYMNVIQDAALLSLNQNNVDVLQEQLRQTKDRFDVGEVTRTDVAQAESSLAGAQAQVLTANTTLQAAIATYRQYVGDEPKDLAPTGPVSKGLPKSVQDAIRISELEHPSVVGALHAVDVAALAVKLAEGALYPTLGLAGNVSQRYEPDNITNAHAFTASAVAQLNVPIYQGGEEYASIRQAKESLSQAELQADQARDQVRAAVVAAWNANIQSPGVLRAAKAQVDAAEVALAGTREEAKVGQRTTLDVLNAQQTLLTARSQLVGAQHDAVVNSYNLVASIGRLSPEVLGLHVAAYDPTTHFDQVKNLHFGVRTPDGK